MINRKLYYLRHYDPAEKIADGVPPVASDVDYIHAAVQESAANNAFTSITQPDVPRVLTASFDAGWQGGDITITGTDINNKVVSEVIADSVGATVAGTQVFKTVSSITKETVAGTTDTVTIGVNTTVAYYSAPWKSDDGQNLHVVATSTGALTGTFTLWYSSKPRPSLLDDTDWEQDTGWGVSNPAGASASFMDDSSNAKAYWKRIKYVPTSGTGTIYAYLNCPSRI